MTSNQSCVADISAPPFYQYYWLKCNNSLRLIEAQVAVLYYKF